MIRFRFMAIAFGQLWFDEVATPPMPDILILRHSRTRPESGPISTKRSLLTDLTKPEEQLWESIGKTCRYKIRRAETKDGVKCFVNLVPSIVGVNEFADFYDRFARQKSLSPINPRRFAAMAHAGRLRVSRAEINENAVVRHAYVTAGRAVRLIYSASFYRDVDAETRAVIGRANRLLHWRDMISFKAGGFDQLDWGGLFADESAPDRRGINDFKREFGGTPMDYFDGYRACSLLGRTVLQLASLVVHAKQLVGKPRFKSPPAHEVV